MKMLSRQNEQGSATLAIISVDNLCLLHQYKWPEHNQNTIAAINQQQRALRIKFYDHS